MSVRAGSMSMRLRPDGECCAACSCCGTAPVGECPAETLLDSDGAFLFDSNGECLLESSGALAAPDAL